MGLGLGQPIIRNHNRWLSTAIFHNYHTSTKNWSKFNPDTNRKQGMKKNQIAKPRGDLYKVCVHNRYAFLNFFFIFKKFLSFNSIKYFSLRALNYTTPMCFMSKACNKKDRSTLPGKVK